MAVYASSKSVSKAKSLKVEGNKYFEQDLNTAVRYYTQVRMNKAVFSIYVYLRLFSLLHILVR